MTRPRLLLVGATVVLWGGVVALMLVSPQVPHEAVRVASAAILVATACHVAATRRDLLLSPVFLLGAVAIVFFSLGPWLLLGALDYEWFLAPRFLVRARHYVTGQGELVVLQFAVMSLLATLLLCRWLGPGGTPASEPAVPGPGARIDVALSLALIVGALLPFLLQATGSAPSAGIAGALFRQLRDAAPAVMAFSVAVLFFTAVGRDRRWLIPPAIGVALVCAAVFSTHMSKIAILVTLAGTGAYVLRTRLSPRRIALALVSAVVFFAIGLTAVSMTRPSSENPLVNTTEIYKHLVRKLLQRQATTAGCLQTVIEKRAPDGRGSGLFYFADAVVPRFLWPEKPNLSRGGEFAVDYCGFRPEDISRKYPQSSSITLLGEPIIENGWQGLAVAQILLIVALSAATLIAARTGTLGAISLVAMLPWLADFDQQFTMYFALTTKMFIWMIPLIAIYGLVGRTTGRDRRTNRPS